MAKVEEHEVSTTPNPVTLSVLGSGSPAHFAIYVDGCGLILLTSIFSLDLSFLSQ
jgi:hypothetical protein